MTDINTPETTLLETRALMRFDYNNGSEVQYFFDPEGADDEPYPHSVQVSTKAWLEMGRPEVVTVSVRPGEHFDRERPTVGRVGRAMARTIGYLVGTAAIIGIVFALVFAILGLSRLLEAMLS